MVVHYNILQPSNRGIHDTGTLRADNFVVVNAYSIADGGVWGQSEA